MLVLWISSAPREKTISSLSAVYRLWKRVRGEIRQYAWQGVLPPSSGAEEEKHLYYLYWQWMVLPLGNKVTKEIARLSLSCYEGR